MRGKTERQATMFAVPPDAMVPQNHPIRRIKPIVEEALKELSPQFEAMYAERGQPSVPPEHLLKASLLMAFFSIRSERQSCEQLNYNMLFKWFLELNGSDQPFHPTSFSQNRERLLKTDVAGAFPRRGGGGWSRKTISGGRDLAGGVGLAQELPSARRAGESLPAPRRRAQPGSGLPRAEAPQGDACLDDRS
jgi:transposase